MATGHAIRGAASAALTLIILEAVATSSAGRVAGFATDVSNLLAKAIDPKVPLLRDRRTAAPSSTAGGYFTGLTPDENQAVNDAKKMNPALPGAINQAAADPNSWLSQLQNLNLTGIGNANLLLNPHP